MPKDIETIIKEISFEKVRVTNEAMQKLREEYESVKSWLGNIGSPETQRNYSFLLIQFCSNAHLTPKELIEIACSRDPKERYLPMKRLLENWRDKAKEQGISVGTRRNTLTMLESFFEWNDVEIGKIKKPIYRPKEKKEIKVDDLKQFRNALGNFRNTALFDFLCCVPLRIGQFKPCKCGEGDCKDKNHWLPKWGDIQSFPKIEYGSVVIIGAKKGHTNSSYYELGKGTMHISFLTESASASLNAYKDLREKTEKREMLPSEPIFVQWRETKDNGNGREPIRTSEVNRIFEYASKSSGKKFTVHNLRNFVQSMLERHGVIPRWREIILGHKVSNLTEAYSTHSIETMWEGSKEITGLKDAINYVDIGNGTSRRSFQQGEEIQKLKEANKGLEGRLEEVEIERDELRKEIADLKARTEALKDLSKSVPIDYKMAKALLGLLSDEDALGNLRIALRDKIFKEDIKELAEKGEEKEEA